MMYNFERLVQEGHMDVLVHPLSGDIERHGSYWTEGRSGPAGRLREAGPNVIRSKGVPPQECVRTATQDPKDQEAQIAKAASLARWWDLDAWHCHL